MVPITNEARKKPIVCANLNRQLKASRTLATLRTCRIFEALDRERRNAGLGAIDLVIQREAHHEVTKQEAGSFANAAATKGLRLA